MFCKYRLAIDFIDKNIPTSRWRLFINGVNIDYTVSNVWYCAKIMFDLIIFISIYSKWKYNYLYKVLSAPYARVRNVKKMK